LIFMFLFIFIVFMVMLSFMISFFLFTFCLLFFFASLRLRQYSRNRIHPGYITADPKPSDIAP
jgi:hypothetical protein